MSKILFAEHGGNHVLKLVGDIRVNLAPTLNAFLQKVGDAGEKGILVDVTEAICIDSTCLGLLAKLALASEKHLGAKPAMVTTNPDVTRVIDSMGFEEIFVLIREQAEPCNDASELPTHVMNEEQLCEQVLEAHKTLMQLSEHNETCFCDLVAALENEKAEKSGTKAPTPSRISA